MTATTTTGSLQSLASRTGLTAAADFERRPPSLEVVAGVMGELCPSSSFAAYLASKKANQKTDNDQPQIVRNRKLANAAAGSLDDGGGATATDVAMKALEEEKGRKRGGQATIESPLPSEE